MNKTTWLAIEPVDTLFFRGSESMEAGENHEVDTLFPPMPSTLIGAIRSAILRQKGISPKKYLANSDIWKERFPLLGDPESPGFDLIGPLFTVGEEYLFPAPANWYASLPDEVSWGDHYQVQAARPQAKNTLGLCGSIHKPAWITKPVTADMTPLLGYWCTLKSLEMIKKVKKYEDLRFINSLEQLGPGRSTILPGNAIFAKEERIGLAMTSERTAKEGHLYSTVHVRLKDGVKLVVGISSSSPFCLDNEGILQLGGEQRVCHYTKQTAPDLSNDQKGGELLALSPLCLSTLSKELCDLPRVSGKLLRIGGWDMKKGFHKPVDAWLPAGTLFFTEKRLTLPQCLNL